MAWLNRSCEDSAATCSGAKGQQRTCKGGSVARANMRNTLMWRCCSRVDGGQRLLGRLKLHNAPALGAACTQSTQMQSPVSAHGGKDRHAWWGTWPMPCRRGNTVVHPLRASRLLKLPEGAAAAQQAEGAAAVARAVVLLPLSRCSAVPLHSQVALLLPDRVSYCRRGVHAVLLLLGRPRCPPHATLRSPAHCITTGRSALPPCARSSPASSLITLA